MANIIASGDWWRLEDDGTLYVYCVGDMPDYGAFAPWSDYYELITDAVISDSVTSIGNGAFTTCASLTSVTIPDSVTSIGDDAFADCALTSVTMPDSVTSIGEFAFYHSALTSVTVPDGVISLGYNAFGDCAALASATIGDGVTSIDEFMFCDCASLTSVTIGASVANIRDGAFDGCTSLTDVYYAGAESQWNAITIYSDNEPLENATIHYNYAPTPTPITLSGIAIATPPTKTAYAAGETFDPTGMVVTATYSDGTTATVTGYSTSPTTALTVSDTSVTVSYAEDGVTKTATVDITVAGQITYNGQSKPIRRIVEIVNALYARTPRLFIDGDSYISMDYGGNST